MIADVVRVAVVLVCGVGLWAALRAFRGDRALVWIVGLGFAARACGSAILFWVSYLDFPLASSLQLGGGHWFFAIDGVGYFESAERAASAGPGAIWTLDPTLPSVFYIKTLALSLYVFGRVVSSSMLLNLIAYLGTVLVLCRLADATGATRATRVFVVSAVSFTPSWILWSTQPLKDTFFLMLVAAFVVALHHTARATRVGRDALVSAVVASAAAWALLYGVAGIRWYFAILLLIATALTTVATTWLATGRRLRVGVALAIVLAALSQAVPAGAGPYLPDWALDILHPWRGSAPSLAIAMVQAPAEAAAVAERARQGLINSRGSTEIQLPPDPVAEAPALLPVADVSVPTDIAAATAVPDAPAPVQTAAPTAVRRPETTAQKVFLGGVAMFVPRAIAQRAGWIYIGGGRGLLAFAELDTIVFTTSCLGAVLLVLIAVRRGLRPDPVFWSVLGLTVLIAVPLAYEATNFGTLIRQRNMVMLGFLLLPLLLGRPGDRRTSGATTRA